jgi:hypothetical protein
MLRTQEAAAQALRQHNWDLAYLMGQYFGTFTSNASTLRASSGRKEVECLKAA